MIGVTEKGLYAWRRTRRGPPFLRIGRMIRYTEDDVCSWLDAQREETLPPRASRQSVVSD
jgi:hypothetical protein